MTPGPTPEVEEEDIQKPDNLTQWMVKDGNKYYPTVRTVSKISPGAYEIELDRQTGQHYFQQVPLKTDGLYLLPDSKTNDIVIDVQKFWENQDLYDSYEMSYKRGIILFGPPGSGKSGTIQLVIREIIKRDGIVVRMKDPEKFDNGYREFREVEPETPLLVVMEDLDGIIKRFGDTEILNTLDGMNKVRNIVFLATTNYPHLLAERFLNRPGRFDRRFLIGFPSAQMREAYLERLIQTHDDGRDIDMARWVSDTENLTIAHMKELFLSVVVYGYPYAASLVTLKNMKEPARDESAKVEASYE